MFSDLKRLQPPFSFGTALIIGNDSTTGCFSAYCGVPLSQPSKKRISIFLSKFFKNDIQ